MFQIFRRGSDRVTDLSWDALKKEVTLAVENEVAYSDVFKDFSGQYEKLEVLI